MKAQPMKANLFVAAVLAAAFASSAQSAEVQYLSVNDVADITGMEVQEVRLMLGAHSTNPLYRTSFIRVSREWNEAVAANSLMLSKAVDSRGNAIVRVSRAVSAPTS